MYVHSQTQRENFLMTKLLSRDELVGLRNDWRAQKKSVGFTSGVFDLIHPGHIDYLEKAKTHCDILLIGVNADSSVRQLGKGDLRPVNPVEARAAVLAGLAAVDYVFIFDEKNNNQNIESLKPDVYIKAGDYTKDKLSSAPIVESYGGRVEIIPFLKGYSTTDTINKIVDHYGLQMAVHLEKELPEARPAVFLDRDGTICKHVDYLHEPEKFEFLPGALEGMKKFYDAGYRVVIITNQPGIGMGYFTKEDFYRVNKEMLRGCAGAGIMVDKIYFSPYSKADNTRCRKPGTELVERAKEDLNLDIPASVVVGDMTSDIQLAVNAGCHSILVSTGQAGEDNLYDVAPEYTASSLLDAAEKFLAGK